MENSKEKKPSIGAWENPTKTGKTFIQFTINGKSYTMWKNGFKTKPTHPDYIIYENEPQKPVVNE
jgi:hypothetical protein